MSKLSVIAIGAILGVSLPAAPVLAQPVSGESNCATGDGPAVLVHLIGLKSASGSIRVQFYGGNPARYFDKGTYLKRIDLPASTRQICLAAPGPGAYAVSVRHDVNGNGKSDMSDGGGMSGNPDVSLLDLAFKRKPSPQKVQIKVANGITHVNIVMNYVQGGSFMPLKSASR